MIKQHIEILKTALLSLYVLSLPSNTQVIGALITWNTEKHNL